MTRPAVPANQPGVSKSSLVLAIVLISFLAGCRLPTAGQLNYTRNEPRQSDLFGVWLPEKASLELMRDKGGYDRSIQPKLILNTDGTFQLVSMPDWWTNDFGESRKGFESFSGNWGVLKDAKTWTIQLRTASGTRFVNLIGQSSPYRLDFIIGDADENQSMIFIKQ